MSLVLSLKHNSIHSPTSLDEHLALPSSMEDPYKSRPSSSSSSSSIRFLGVLKKPPVVSESIPLEFEEFDVVWTTTASNLSDSSRTSTTDHSPAPNSPSNLPRQPFRPEKFGLNAAFSDDHASLLQRKTFLNPSLSAASAARIVPPVPSPRSGSNSEDVSRSAPVDVPVWLRSRGLGFRNDGDGDEESEDEMVPPHEIVARSHATSFSVFEGVGRTLKGRDMRRVRDAVWQKTGFMD